MRKISVVAILLFFILALLSCQNTDQISKDAATVQKPIDSIYLLQSGFGMTFPEYKIDLKNKQFWSFTSEVENYQPRDPSAKDEGFTFVCGLAEDKIATFLLESSRNGFTDWKSTYDNPDMYDGLQWGVTICFSDGTRKQTDGSNAFPKTWKPICSALETLTGTEVLPIDVSGLYQ